MRNHQRESRNKVLWDCNTCIGILLILMSFLIIYGRDDSDQEQPSPICDNNPDLYQQYQNRLTEKQQRKTPCDQYAKEELTGKYNPPLTEGTWKCQETRQWRGREIIHSINTIKYDTPLNPSVFQSVFHNQEVYVICSQETLATLYERGCAIKNNWSPNCENIARKTGGLVLNKDEYRHIKNLENTQLSNGDTIIHVNTNDKMIILKQSTTPTATTCTQWQHTYP